MKKLISRQLLAVLALLASSASMAATVTITASNLAPAVGDTFTLTVTSDAQNTFAATMALAFDAANVAYVSGVPLSPWNVYTKNSPTTANPTVFDVEAPSAVSGATYNVAVLTFQALATGAAGIVINDDGGNVSGWFDATTADWIPVTYTQADVVVTPVASGPNIVVTDSVPPPDDLQIPFGSVTLNTTSTQTLTITNSGDADLILYQLGTLGPGGQGAPDALFEPFGFSNDTCSNQTIAPLASCTVQVRFLPTSLVGLQTDSFGIPSNDPDTVTVIVSVSGTGIAVVAPNIVVTDSVAPTNDHQVPFGSITLNTPSTQTVTVTNSGNAALNVGQVAGLAAPFSLGTDNCSNQAIAAAGSCTIDVQFDPIAAGPFSGTLNIPSDDPDTATVTVNVGGTGVALAPNIAVTDSVAPTNDLAIPFGSITQGGTSTQTVTVTNSGAATLNVGQVAGLTGAFSLGTDGCSNQAIAVAASCTMQVQFDPVALGLVSSSLNIPSDDPDTATVAVSVNGTGVAAPAPDITVTDSVAPANDLTVPFGPVTLAATQSQTITVTNDGSADLAITGVVAPLAPFTITSNLCTAASPLAPTESCTITVAFTPDLAQVYNGSLSISSNDGDEGTVVVALSGTGSNGILVIDGGSSAVDFLSLSLLAGLPLLRRRRR